MAKTKNVRLIRKWSDWDVGDVVTLDAARALRVVAKGYGVMDDSPEAARRADVEIRGGPPLRQPKVETALAPTEAERADVTPDIRWAVVVPSVPPAPIAGPVGQDSATVQAPQEHQADDAKGRKGRKK